MFTSFKIRDYDFKLILMVAALAAIGVFAIGSAEEALQSRQLYGVLFGLLIMLILSFFNYNFMLKMYWLIYLLNIALLLAVMFLGETHKGAQRWLEFGSITFQPSETAKILLILFFAQFIMKYKDKLNTIHILGLCLILLLIPWALVYAQPDLSTSVMLLAIFCVIMFAGGISWKIIVSVLAVAIPTLIILVSLAVNPDQTLLKGHRILTDSQRNRILSFIDPEEYATTGAYQQLNSVIAIGSGQLDGKGYKNNEITSVKNGDFISEAENDFIFSVIGEEFGFKGCVVVIALTMVIALECISIARKAKDTAGKIIAAGMGGLMAFQGFFNMGVATFILPNTGLPLPFVSYGLTSLISNFIGIGIVLNVRLQAGRSTAKQEL